MPLLQTTSSDNQSSESPAPWSVRRRSIVSVLLALHLLAVISAPMASPPPASELSGHIARWFEPYLFAAFLNHGYRFFAPNPGPSHLVLYELDLPDGSVKKGRFPNLDEHWPRLHYHRYLMISESVFDIADVPDIDPLAMRQEISRLREAAERLEQLGFMDQAFGFEEQAQAIQDRLEGRLNDQQRRSLDLARKQKEALLTGIAQDLLRRHGATSVRLYVQTHDIPNPEDVLRGTKLDDAQLYGEPQLLGEFTGDEE